jgi:hypothetical protein
VNSLQISAGRFDAYVLSLVTPIARSLGWASDGTESHTTKMLRSKILQLAVDLEDEVTVHPGRSGFGSTPLILYMATGYDNRGTRSL